MKKRIIACVCILFIGGLLYVNYNLTRLQKERRSSISPITSVQENQISPVVENRDDTQIANRTDVLADDTDRDVSITDDFPSDTMQADTSVFVEDFLDESDESLDTEVVGSEDVNANAGVPQPPNDMSLAAWHASLSESEKAAVYVERPWLKPISEMTDQELETEVSRRKQRLIDDYGNTPTVELINSYTTPAFLRGEPLSLSSDEGLAYVEAIGILFPTPENIDFYLELELLKDLGWREGETNSVLHPDE